MDHPSDRRRERKKAPAVTVRDSTANANVPFLQTKKGKIISGCILLALVLAIVVGATCGAGLCSSDDTNATPVSSPSTTEANAYNSNGFDCYPQLGCFYTGPDGTFPLLNVQTFMVAYCVKSFDVPTPENCNCSVHVGTIQESEACQSCSIHNDTPSIRNQLWGWDVVFDCSNLLNGPCVGRDENSVCISNIDSSTAAPNGPAPSSPTISPIMAPTPAELECNGRTIFCDLRVTEILFATVVEFSFEAALEAGFRGINVGISKCDGDLQLIHINCTMGARDAAEAFSNIASFLEANPSEVIMMPTQIIDDTVTIQEINVMMEGIPGLKELLYDHPDPATRWPTLRELIDANTRILFFQYNRERWDERYCANIDCPSGFHDWFDYATETRQSFGSIADVLNTDVSCEITRGRNGSSFFGINVFMAYPSCFALCETLNARDFLESHIEACMLLTGEGPNLLLVDCWAVGDVLAVVRSYNEIVWLSKIF